MVEQEGGFSPQETKAQSQTAEALLGRISGFPGDSSPRIARAAERLRAAVESAAQIQDESAREAKLAAVAVRIENMERAAARSVPSADTDAVEIVAPTEPIAALAAEDRETALLTIGQELTRAIETVTARIESAADQRQKTALGEQLELLQIYERVSPADRNATWEKKVRGKLDRINRVKRPRRPRQERGDSRRQEVPRQETAPVPAATPAERLRESIAANLPDMPVEWRPLFAAFHQAQAEVLSQDAVALVDKWREFSKIAARSAILLRGGKLGDYLKPEHGAQPIKAKNNALYLIQPARAEGKWELFELDPGQGWALIANQGQEEFTASEAKIFLGY